MNKALEYNKITKQELLTLKEEDLLFITNPGRMGDTDGITFIIKTKDSYKTYRVTGLQYRNTEEKDPITILDIINVFPKWEEAWTNYRDENYKGKYTYIYMGFGNGLCVDNRIYEKYLQYLKEEAKKQEYYQPKTEQQLYYSVWQQAFKNMIEEKKD